MCDKLKIKRLSASPINEVSSSQYSFYALTSYLLRKMRKEGMPSHFKPIRSALLVFIHHCLMVALTFIGLYPYVPRYSLNLNIKIPDMRIKRECSGILTSTYYIDTE
jgi:hypothetical protein